MSMTVTIKKIAEVSGVSRGTVDRVINNRGKVNPETAEKVRRVAEELGYSPNIAGKALAARKKAPVIGAVLSSEGNPFYFAVIRNIEKAVDELGDYGVSLELKTMRGYDAARQLELIEELEDRISLLIISPISDMRISDKINRLYDRGIATVTVNNDIEDSSRICYVGSNYRKGGEMACGMMGILTRGRANLGIIMGSTKVLGHSQRIAGFRDVMKSRYPEMRAVDFIEINDDDFIGYDETRRMLAEHPEIDSLFIVAAGVYGVCRAVKSLGLERKLTIVSFDDVPSTVEMIREGIINATICQQPEIQGQQAVRIAFDSFIGGKLPEGGVLEVKNEIKIYESFI